MTAADELREKIAAGRVVVFCGAGVAHATNPAAPGWPDLLRSGIEYLAERFPADDMAPLRDALDAADPASAGDLVAVGDQLEELLRRREGFVAGWLQGLLGALTVDDPALIEAVDALGAPLMTTNYDRLIEDVTGRSPAVWDVDEEFRISLDQPGYVAHLHGTYLRPASVVLGSGGYERVDAATAVQELLEAQLATKSALFVGFGTGLDDPNLGRLLDWFGTTFAATSLEHYVLVPDGEVDALLAAGWPATRGLVPVGYGEDHDALPPFLAALAPARELASRSLRDLPPRNLRFEGREPILAALRERLTAGRTTALTALRGAGGVGKTQVALEYAHRFATAYRVAWWVEAENPGGIPGRLTELAARLGLGRAGDWAVTWDQLSDWFAAHDDWLLVFDNAPDRPAVAPYLPPDARGHVLISSRDPGWAAAARLDVGVFTEEEAAAFLATQLGGADAALNAALVAELGRLPLALTQAAAYILDAGIEVSEYLGLLRERPAELLAHGQADDYPETVFRTIELSIERSEEICAASPDCEAVEELLALCAFLDPDGVPIALLGELDGDWPEGLRRLAADRLRQEAVVAALRRTGVVERSGGELKVHRLTQQVVRHRLGDHATDWHLRTLRLVEELLPDPVDHLGWERFAELLPLALAVADLPAVTEEAAASAARVLGTIGIFQQSIAVYREAAATLRRAVAIKEAVYGEEHPEVARTLSNLGIVQQHMGEWVVAAATQRRALAIFEVVYGEEHPKVARTLTNLGVVQRHLGELAGAGATLRRALAIFEEAVYGREHPDVARTLGNLGVVQRQLGELAAAEATQRRALAIFEAVFGGEHPEVAISLKNLGIVQGQLGELAAAEASMWRALAIEEAVFGGEHPEVARTLSNLGIVQQHMGEWVAAEASLRRALAIFEARLGPDHPHTRQTRAIVDEMG